jgi:hypothetical protein
MNLPKRFSGKPKIPFPTFPAFPAFPRRPQDAGDWLAGALLIVFYIY